MVFRGRPNTSSSSSGSLTWFLLTVVSLLVVVGVHPSPYPNFGEQLPPYQMPPQQQGPPGEVTAAAAALNYNEDPELAYPEELDYEPNANRLEEVFYDKRSESNRNLQQILRSFPLVVGGPSPSDHILPDSWSSPEEASTLAHQGRGTGLPNLSKGATLTHLIFSDSRPKRVMCHFKICNLGRRRRARLSSPLQGWLS